MSVRLCLCLPIFPSARPHGTSRLPLDGFSRKSVLENSSFIKIWHLFEDQYTFLIIFRSFLLRMENVSDKSCRENQNTILCSVAFFSPRKSCRLRDNMEKYCRAGQASDDNMAHAHCVLDTYGYRRTLRICNTYCFSTVTVVARMPLNITL